MGYLKDNIRALAEAIERESVLIHRDALIDGYREIHKLSKLGVDRIIKKAAEYGGKKGARTLRDRYGVFTDRLEMYVEGSILVEAVGESPKPVCKPMAGFFKGFLSTFLDRKFEVEEVTCAAQGYERCTFKIKQR